MPTRTEKFQALPRAAQIGVVAVLAALGVWLFVGMSDFNDDPGVAGCEAFAGLVDDVNDGSLDATSDEVVDRLEGIGQAMSEGDGEIGDVGSYVGAQVDVARTFPEDRDRVLSDVVERVGQVC